MANPLLPKTLLFGVLGVLGVVLSLAACEGEALPELEEKPDVARTTAPRIAVANLNSQIDSLLRQVEIDPHNIETREMVVGLLLARTQYLGTYDDFDVAFAVVLDTLEMGLVPARAAVLHAKLLSAVHRFDEALGELALAEELGAERQTTMRESIALARGDAPEEIVRARELAAASAPSFGSLTALAAALRSAQRFSDSDRAYRDALDTYRDVSPFPLAWVAFQRGIMWGEDADNEEEALSQYRLAVATLPQYVVGTVHLAELEVARGDSGTAIERLEAIVFETEDPEPASRLAEFLAASDPERARDYAEFAADRYEYYLERYPLAFADHACEFYLGAGNNPGRALDLALLNLENRTTPRAYGLAIESAFSAGLHILGCSIAEEGGLLDSWTMCE